MSFPSTTGFVSSGVRLACTAALLSLAAACTGDDMNPVLDDDAVPAAPGSEPTTQDPVAPSAQDGAANGPLTGRLITTADFPHRNALVSLDLQSGRYALLEGADPPSAIRNFDNDDTERALVADYAAPGRFVETQTHCAGNVGVRCVGFWGAGANIESVFSYDDQEILGPDWGLAKRSRDGRFVALLSDNLRSLEVRTTAGEVVSSVEYGYNPNSPYDWLPDGSIVIESEPSGATGGPVQLARTEPYSATPASIITLPEQYEGLVFDISVDPSGTRLALLFKPTVGNSLFQRPIVLDLNTNMIHEPVAPSSDTDILRAVDMHWSPDGQWLMFRNENFAHTLPPLFPTTNFTGFRTGRTYAVRTDGGSYPLPEESNDKVRIVLTRPLDDPNGPLSSVNATSGVWVD